MKTLVVLIIICWALNVNAQDRKIEIKKRINNVERPVKFYMIFARDTLWDKAGVITIPKALNDKYTNSLFWVHLMELDLGKGFKIPSMLTKQTQLSDLCNHSPFIILPNITR